MSLKNVIKELLNPDDEVAIVDHFVKDTNFKDGGVHEGALDHPMTDHGVVYRIDEDGIMVKVGNHIVFVREEDLFYDN